MITSNWAHLLGGIKKCSIYEICCGRGGQQACSMPGVAASSIDKSPPGHAPYQALGVCAGAIDALMLLNPYLAPGCIVLFDDLINYPDYREHEIRALWEWLQASKRQVEVCGVSALPVSLIAPLLLLKGPSAAPNKCARLQCTVLQCTVQRLNL